MPISPNYQSNLPIDPRPLSCVLLRPAPHAAALLPLSHAPIHSRIICCRGRAVRYSEWHATACCIRSRRRGSLTTAPPRLAHDSAAAARPPTTSSLVLPRAHGRLHEHARGTPALPTHVPTLTTALIPALKPALTTAAHRAHSEPTCSPPVRAACDHPTQLSAAGRGRHPISAAEGIGRTVHRAARVRPST